MVFMDTYLIILRVTIWNKPIRFSWHAALAHNENVEMYDQGSHFLDE